MTHPDRGSRFDPDTRKRLAEKYKEQRRNLGADNLGDLLDEEAEVFLRILENYAHAIPLFEQHDPPKTQKRKECVKGLSNKLSGLLDALKEIDSTALGYIAFNALKILEDDGTDISPALEPYTMDLEHIHAAIKGEELKPKLTPHKAACLAFDARKELIPILAALSVAAKDASRELPVYDFDTTLKTALAVERTFWENGLPFVATDSSFAGECLREVYQLGGLQIDRVQYHLQKALDSEESMARLMARQNPDHAKH